MLSRFIIEPSAIINEQFGTDVATMKQFLGQLVTFWSRHGVFIQPVSGTARAEWEAVIETLPIKLRQNFKALFLDDVPLPECRTVYVKEDFSFDDVCSYNDLVAMTSAAKADLALLEPVRALEFGLGDDEFCACDGFPDLAKYTEITRWHLVSRACKIENFESLSGKDIKSSDDPSSIWEQRLKSYAEHSREIIIGDPYATYDLRNDKPFRHQSDLNHGLINLLRYIISIKPRGEERRAPNMKIRVFATYDNGHDANPNNSLACIHEVLNDEIIGMRDPGSRVKQVDVYLVPSDSYLFHDRWLRFDHNAFVLGKGVEVFNHVHSVRRKNAGDSDFQMKGWDGMMSTKADEERLANACTGMYEHFAITVR